MRVPRCFFIDGTREQYFHVMSRVVDRRMVFGRAEKVVFRRMLRGFENFSGCEVVTYCVMDNHFHLLVRVPVRPDEISDEEVWRRMKFIYNQERMDHYEQQLRQYLESGRDDEISAFYEGMRRRMFNLSCFIKDLKQKFTRWYNLEHERKGTLWEERFKSVVVEGDLRALLMVAAYIDLNPVRAGIVGDARDYSWNGYGEALRGDAHAIARIQSLFSHHLNDEDITRGLLHYGEYLKYRKSVVCAQAEPDLMSADDGDTVNVVSDLPDEPSREGSFGQAANEGAPGLLEENLDRGEIRPLIDALAIGSADFLRELYARISEHLKGKRGFRRNPLPGEMDGSRGLCGLRAQRGQVLIPVDRGQRTVK